MEIEKVIVKEEVRTVQTVEKFKVDNCMFNSEEEAKNFIEYRKTLEKFRELQKVKVGGVVFYYIKSEEDKNIFEKVEDEGFPKDIEYPCLARVDQYEGVLCSPDKEIKIITKKDCFDLANSLTLDLKSGE